MNMLIVNGRPYSRSTGARSNTLVPVLHKCIFGSTYSTIEELIEKLKRIYAPAKGVYQLQGELGNKFMWERENVLSYAATFKRKC